MKKNNMNKIDEIIKNNSSDISEYFIEENESILMMKKSTLERMVKLFATPDVSGSVLAQYEAEEEIYCKWYKCSKCNSKIIKHGDKYCCSCGSRLHYR